MNTAPDLSNRQAVHDTGVGDSLLDINHFDLSGVKGRDAWNVEASVPAPIKAKEHIIAQLVGRVFRDAPLSERGHILEHLLSPFGVLSLMAVASGIFAKIRFRSGWPDAHIQLRDVSRVQVSDVTSLVDYVQQSGVLVMENFGQLISVQPVVAGTAAAAVLVMLLKAHEMTRTVDSSLSR